MYHLCSLESGEGYAGFVKYLSCSRLLIHSLMEHGIQAIALFPLNYQLFVTICVHSFSQSAMGWPTGSSLALMVLLASSQTFLVAHCFPLAPHTQLPFTDDSELAHFSPGNTALIAKDPGLGGRGTPSVNRRMVSFTLNTG